MFFTWGITKTNFAKKSTTRHPLRRNFHKETPWQQSRHLCGCQGLRKFCVRCPKCIIYSICIVWLNAAISILLLATRMARSHCCPRLAETLFQTKLGKTIDDCVSNLFLMYHLNLYMIPCSVSVKITNFQQKLLKNMLGKQISLFI